MQRLSGAHSRGEIRAKTSSNRRRVTNLSILPPSPGRRRSRADTFPPGLPEKRHRLIPHSGSEVESLFSGVRGEAQRQAHLARRKTGGERKIGNSPLIALHSKKPCVFTSRIA
ncbi:hypothetical protein CesoFtcFv8_001511 [Champsocephalus esox]|uniref:Uncharacterized protein n=2 Tax=Champsocephalus TaxID=52236 RepID=A0AAN8ESQ2_CHAGU|nr:hypothetical protein CesoFtcFv8_001511 [Champsocephalus esox]KAK5935908.1 hypothetical protein CgunFtcFv8_021221 [Champsocephalus gunnari]